MDKYIIVPIVVGIICAILGYFLGREKNNEGDSSDLKKKIKDLQADLDACRKNNLKVSSSSSLAPTKVKSNFDAASAKEAFGKKIKENDLTVVEGIGPKISQLFHNHDVKTWKSLSECSIDKCQEVLKSGGDRFKMHVPGTWPKQAKLAYEGKWKELSKWQGELKGGK